MSGLRLNNWSLALLIALALIWSVAGCTKGTVDEQSAGGGTTTEDAQVKVVALAGTDAGVLSGIQVSVNPGPGGFEVQATAGEEMKELKELFFRLEFDGTSLHSNAIEVNGVNADNGVIGLAVESEPGKVDVGLVATALATGPAVRPGDALVSFQLLRGAGERNVSEAAGNDTYKAQNLTLSQSEGGQWVLAWDYTNPGDTNGDGQVGIQDLQPIGLYYGQNVPNTYQDPRRNVDCDRNGVINMGDVVRIGQNYSNRVYSYKIEVSPDGVSAFTVIGERTLSEVEKEPGVAIRFEYAFPVIGGESTYIENAWYRVVPFLEDLGNGPASSAICQSGREVDANKVVTVVLCAQGLDPAKPFAHLNTVRVEYPSSYEYIVGSANTGSIGGARDFVDGIWATFCTQVLFPPDGMIATFDLGDKTAIELGMASTVRTLPAAPDGYGDIINFQLKNNGNDPLILNFVERTDDGIDRTYYCDADGTTYKFGDALGMAIFF